MDKCSNSRFVCAFFADMSAVQWSSHLDEVAAWVNGKLDDFYAISDPNDSEEMALAEEIIQKLFLYTLYN